MKRFLYFIVVLVVSVATYAQPMPGRKFNPDQFMREQEAFITKEVRLTPQEANAFFPVYREFAQKQRELFLKQRQLVKDTPADDKAAAKIINEMNCIDASMNKLRVCYYARFVKILGAKKVFLCINADERFKHSMMEKFARGKQNRK